MGAWRQGGYVGVTRVTAGLLEYWTREGRDKKLFFCQIEALQTAIYITEVARKYGDAWIDNDLMTANDTSNPGLPRVALKMATGSGKTVVMAMLIAWHALNKIEDRQDARFSDALMPEVVRYVKNQGLGFTIPYTLKGEERQSYPDFIAHLGDLNLIVEVSGEARKDKTAKVTTARTLWVPAVNNHGGFGRWAFVEVTDPWDAQRTIRAAVATVAAHV